MNNERLYIYDGSIIAHNHQLNLNTKKKVVVKDAGIEVCIDDVKSIEIETRHEDKITIYLSSRGNISFENKKIIIHDRESAVLIAVISSDEDMKEYNALIAKQSYYELIDYILQYTPNLYEKDKLELMTYEELQDIKEKVFELANSY